jgi:hypothetical protein
MQVLRENEYYGVRKYNFLSQGILGMLSAIFGQQFFYDCYNPVGEMMDMMALINSAANYILYCLMSSDFRQTLRKLSGLEDKPLKLLSPSQPSIRYKFFTCVHAKSINIF